MRAFVKRYEIIAFFALALVIGWLPWWSGGAGFIAGGVSVAGLIVLAFAEGKQGLLDALRRAVRWRVSPAGYVVALFLPAAIALAAIAIHMLLGGAAPACPFLRNEWRQIPLFIALALLFPLAGPIGEEIFGFRGFALPRLQDRYGPVVASLLVGAFFGTWHLPEFLRPGSSQYAMGMAFYVPFIVAEIGWSTLMTWTYNRSGGSTLVGGMLFHASMNFWICSLLTDFTMSSLQTFPPIPPRLLWPDFGLVTLVAVGVALATRGRLGLPERAAMPLEGDGYALPPGANSRRR